jgi:hypothetical protein
MLILVDSVSSTVMDFSKIITIGDPHLYFKALIFNQTHLSFVLFNLRVRKCLILV